MRTYEQTPCSARFWPKLSVRNFFRIRTYKDRVCNPFRMRSYKKRWGGTAFPISEGSTQGSSLAGVPAAKGVPADHKDVEEHLQAVAEHVDFGGGGMAPT